MIEANLSLKARKRGFTEGEFVEAILLLQTAGGDCPEDARLLVGDRCLVRGLGFEMPKATALREFLERFHDENLEDLRPSRDLQKSFIVPPSGPVQSLQAVQAGMVQHIAKLYAAQGKGHSIATIDQDATIIESHKRAAQYHYEGGRGYQPMVAVWAEAELVVADEFRDGNVPARQAPLNCAKMAFAALPDTVRERYFRGDSACHENELVEWLNDPERTQEPGGRIGFAVSAVMDKALAQAVAQVSDKQWTTYGQEADGTLRQWAEVDFVPGVETEKKNLRPLRYVGLRLLKPQGVLFNDGGDRRHYAVLTNLDWTGARLLKSLSENPCRPPSNDGAGEMQECLIAVDPFLPSDEDAAETIEPGVRTLDDPTAGAVARDGLLRGGFFAPAFDVRNVSELDGQFPNVRIVISSVQA